MSKEVKYVVKRLTKEIGEFPEYLGGVTIENFIGLIILWSKEYKSNETQKKKKKT